MNDSEKANTEAKARMTTLPSRQPFYTILTKAFNGVKSNVAYTQSKHSYGPPYIPNKDFTKELFDEITSSKYSINLLSIHDMLTTKIDPNIKDNKGNTAIHYAARYGNVTLAYMLLRAGSTIDTANFFGQTPLVLAGSGPWNRHTNMIRFLLLKGADVNRTDAGGNNCLVMSVLSSNINSVALLLHHNATVKKTERAFTCHVSPDVVKISHYLRAIDHGFKPNHKKSEEFFRLKKEYKPTIFELIIRLGKRELKSSKITDMLELAEKGRFLNHFEVRCEKVVSKGRSLFCCFNRPSDNEDVVVIEKKETMIKRDETRLEKKLRTQRIRLETRALKAELSTKLSYERNIEAARREINSIELEIKSEKAFKEKVGVGEGIWAVKDANVVPVDSLNDVDSGKRKGKKKKRGKQVEEKAPVVRNKWIKIENKEGDLLVKKMNVELFLARDRIEDDESRFKAQDVVVPFEEEGDKKTKPKEGKRKEGKKGGGKKKVYPYAVNTTIFAE